jgi:hypothetical protein
VGAELFHADRQMDSQDEANSRFSQFCEIANKQSCNSRLCEGYKSTSCRRPYGLQSPPVRPSVPRTCEETHSPILPEFNFRTINPASAGGGGSILSSTPLPGHPLGIPQGIKSDGVNISYSYPPPPSRALKVTPMWYYFDVHGPSNARHYC